MTICPSASPLHDVHVGLADVGLETLRRNRPERGQLPGLLHPWRKFGDPVEQLLSRKRGGHPFQGYDSERIVAVGIRRFAGEPAQFVFDLPATSFGGAFPVVFIHQRHGRRPESGACIVCRGARHTGRPGRGVGVVLDRNRPRFGEEHRPEPLRISFARIGDGAPGGDVRRAFEAELAAFDDGRVDQAVALEHVDGAFEPGDVAFDDVFGSGAATA